MEKAGCQSPALRRFSRSRTCSISSSVALAGHKSVKVTEGYLHEDTELVRQDHAAAGVLGKVLQKRQVDRPRPKKVI